jgi:transposase-like protein
MDGGAFEAWLSAIALLTDQQRGAGFRALALAEAMAGETAAADTQAVPREALTAADAAQPIPRLPQADPVMATAERRVEENGCPHCGGRRLQRWGHSHGLARYRCNTCRRSFNGLTGTSLARLRKKDRWAAQTEAMLVGESLAKAAQRCGVAPSTAFRWRHRFLQAPAMDKPTKLKGIVEADETFILESFKGKRSGLPRPARKRGGKAAKRGLSREQIPVLVARDRTGRTTDAVLPTLSPSAITDALQRRGDRRQSDLLRWRQGNCRVRAPQGDRLQHPAKAGRPKAGSTEPAYQQRQRLSWPPEGMAAAVPWGRDQVSRPLSRLASNTRSARQ